MTGNKQPPLDPPIKIEPYEDDDENVLYDFAEAFINRGWTVGEDAEGALYFVPPNDTLPPDLEQVHLMAVSEAYEIIPTPSAIKEHLDLYVIGQEDAKKAISVALVNHMYRTVYNTLEMGDKVNENKRIKKSNLMFLGDSGVGKTYIVETACKFLGIPFVSVDATRFSAAGFKGADVESILTALLLKANRNICDAQEGIVFIDEFDKLGSSSDSDKDIHTTQVQYSLLKMIEGCIMPVPRSNLQRAEEIDFDTSETLFIFSGAFGGIATKKKQGPEQSFGFLGTSLTHVDEVIEADILKFGIIPEILGRIGQYIPLHALNEDQLRQILMNPHNGPVTQAQRMYSLRFPKKKFPLTEKDYERIIKTSIESKLGARGLAREVQQCMVEHYYD